MTPTATIGRYTLEARLAKGGMAAVFLGRMVGPGGFSKKVVVKRILPEHASNPVFVEMFLTEARLAALLNHPNVVQVYDFGEDHGQYYLAMELIDGVSVRALQHALRKAQQTLSPRLAAHVMAMACAGLHYAHSLTDDQGKPLHLVHRDVSPDNLLVNRMGVVKLVDFGVARVASAASMKTSSGLVKGKLAYMAPEQVSAGEIDRRVDIYAAGVALYELLCGRRPFTAQNELELAVTIMERTAVPLRQVAPHVDERLAAIVERAMQKRRDERFPDAGAMKEALEDYVGNAKDVTAELCAMVAQTTPQQEDLTALHTPSLGLAGDPESGAIEAPEPATAATPASRGVPVRLIVLLALTIAFGAGLVGLAAGRQLFSSNPPPPPVERVPQPQPQPPTPTPTPEPEPEAKLPELEEKAEPDPQPLPSTPTKKKVGDGFLTLRTNPWCEVTIDGTGAGTTPLVKYKLPSGAHVLRLTNEKLGIDKKESITVAVGQIATKLITFPMGQLKVTAPKGTKVFRGSELLGIAPLAPVMLGAGKHTLMLMDASGKYVNRSITVPAGGVAELSP